MITIKYNFRDWILINKFQDNNKTYYVLNRGEKYIVARSVECERIFKPGDNVFFKSKEGMQTGIFIGKLKGYYLVDVSSLTVLVPFKDIIDNG